MLDPTENIIEEEVVLEKTLREGEIFKRLDDESDPETVLREILAARHWPCVYYSGLANRQLIEILAESSKTELLSVLCKTVEDPTALEQEMTASEDWGHKIHFWRAGGLLDNELFIHDFAWSRDGELKAILKDTKPKMILLLGEAATQTEQSHYTWKRGEEYLLGQLKELYEDYGNTGERVRLLLQ